MKFTVLLLILALAGCGIIDPFAEGAIEVRGEIVTTNGTLPSCEVGLWQLQRAWFRNLPDALVQKDEVKGKFATGFLTDTARHDYYFVVSCPGYPAKYTSPKFSHKGVERYKNPVELGKIVFDSKMSEPYVVP